MIRPAPPTLLRALVGSRAQRPGSHYSRSSSCFLLPEQGTSELVLARPWRLGLLCVPASLEGEIRASCRQPRLTRLQSALKVDRLIASLAALVHRRAKILWKRFGFGAKLQHLPR